MSGGTEEPGMMAGGVISWKCSGSCDEFRSGGQCRGPMERLRASPWSELPSSL